MPRIDNISSILLANVSTKSLLEPIGSEVRTKGLSQDQKIKIEKACRDFESLFVQQMMKQMRQTVPQEGLFSGGNAEKTYTSMLDGEMSKVISQQRGIGLAPALIRQLMDLSADEKK